jgi:lipopolysaccharide/colanic/teichoic acid biosynthesis glycosyltransferase
MAKRLFDVCGALLGLLVSLPFLLVVAIAVKLDSAGPVLYIPVRVGRGGRPFRVFKFRSMFVDSDRGSPITTDVDARVTRVGRIIRPLRIDELPQLLNVLIGDMSLVGPRPEAPPIVERYTADQRKVFELRPGITGPTQLDSLDEATRLPADGDPTEYYVRYILPEKLAVDLRYTITRTFAGDIRLLLRTPISLGHLVLARAGCSRLRKVTGRRPA